MTRASGMDSEVQFLAGIAASLKSEYTEGAVDWTNSPFQWIKQRPSSKQRGTIGEKLVAGWLAARDFNVSRSGDSDADRVVENKRVEIKFSTLWDAGTYTFQQFRDQRYDLAVCLGVSPFDAHCWVLSKVEVLHQWREVGNLTSQHGGSSGSDTAWFTVNPSAPAAWLSPFGGRLSAALNRVAALTGFTPPKP